MRESAVYAAFNETAVFFCHFVVPGTVWHMIKRTVTKQTVYMVAPLVAGITAALPVLKISV